MLENDKNSKKVGKKQFLIRKQQRDPQWVQLVILYACFDKDVGLVQILGSKSQWEKVFSEIRTPSGLRVRREERERETS